MNKKGNCYVTCEALYHLLGGKKTGWKSMVMRHEGGTHWFLINTNVPRDITSYNNKYILDPTVSQFKTKPDYDKARGCGFLTKKPSKKAKELMKILVYK